MKEGTLTIPDSILKGLRGFHQRSREVSVYDLFNIRPTDYGLFPYDPVVCPLSTAVMAANDLDDEDFPFPQILVGKKKIFICGETTIFTVDPDDWTDLTELTTYDPETPADTKAITAGGIWRLADFWDTWFLTNGSCVVFACGKDWITSNTQKVFVFDNTTIQAALDYKGRLILGGFDVESFWGSTETTFLGAWYKKNYDTGFNPYVKVSGDSTLAPVYEDFIWWSSIGGGDALMLFFPSEVLNNSFIAGASYDSDEPFLLDILQRNEQGFASMPSKGLVQDIIPLGENIIIFSEYGVSVAKAIPSPSPTFSIKKLDLGGLANRGAVASSGDQLFYVDKSGMLISIDASLKVKAFGYREFFYDMLENTIVGSYSKEPGNKGNFFFSDGSETFVLNKSGLFEVGHRVTSVSYIEGGTVGFVDGLSTDDEILCKIGLDVSNLNLSGVKTIEWVRVEHDEYSASETPSPSLQVAIDYQHDTVGEDSYTSTGYKTVNKEGWVYFPVTGIKFRINIKGSNYENFDFIYIEVGIKAGDKRYQRGFVVGQGSS